MVPLCKLSQPEYAQILNVHHTYCVQLSSRACSQQFNDAFERKHGGQSYFPKTSMHEPRKYQCKAIFLLQRLVFVVVGLCEPQRGTLVDLKPCEFSLALMRCDRVVKLRENSCTSKGHVHNP